MILWVRHFLEAQGVPVADIIVYQDNQSSILLEKNGRASSGKKTLITDNVQRGKKISIEYCPTGDMTADFFTKPLQGSLFRKFRDRILNESNSQECVGNPESGIPRHTCKDEQQTTFAEKPGVGDDVSNANISGKPQTYAQAVIAGKDKLQKRSVRFKLTSLSKRY